MTKDQISVHFKLNAKKNLKTEGLHQAYLQGAEDCWDYIKENEANAYEKGLSDAWGLASKIVNMNCGEIGEAFGTTMNPSMILKCGNPKWYLEKLFSYEDRKNNIHVGDICKFGTNEEIDVYVTMGEGSPISDSYVEGFCLSGKNKGHIGQFKLKELRKTGKSVGIDKILNWEK